MPTTASNSISHKKKFDMLNAEDEKYDDNIDFYDVTDNQFREFSSKERVNINSHQKFLYDRFNLEKIKSMDSESKFEALINNKDYIPHDPINIQSDNDFTEENGVSEGSGTKENPYIIEGWEIDGNEYGIKIWHTTSHFIVRNCLLTAELAIFFNEIIFGAISAISTNANGVGAYVSSSSNITIQDSILYGRYGLLLYDSVSISVDNCSVSSSSNEWYSIYLLDLHFSSLSNMTASEGLIGFLIEECSNTLIRDCDVFSNHYYGIFLYMSKNIILRNNSIYSNDYNLAIEGTGTDHYYHDIDTSNTVNGKPVYYICNKSDLIFDGSVDIGFLGLIKCTRISVEGLTIDSKNRHGILLVETTDSSIVSSTFSNNTYGFTLFGCLNNTIIDCKVSGKYALYGIDLFGGSSKNYILDCEVRGGILLENAPFNILRNNTITGDYINFQVFGNKISDFYQDVDDSNTINGKPIYYFIEEDDLDIYGSNIGYLGFVNCSDVKIHDVFIQYNAQGVLLANTNAVVENCKLWSCSWGIHLFMCSNVKIKKCNFKNNFCGVYLHYSSYNQVLWCDISNNWWEGCFLEKSDNNLIKSCDVNNTGMDAFAFWDSYENEIHNNNIAGNDQSGLFAISSSINATLNWWGSATGPSGIGPGNGDEIISVDSTVLFEPWLKSPRSKQLNYAYSGWFMRLIERFPLLERLFKLI